MAKVIPQLGGATNILIAPDGSLQPGPVLRAGRRPRAVPDQDLHLHLPNLGARSPAPQGAEQAAGGRDDLRRSGVRRDDARSAGAGAGRRKPRAALGRSGDGQLAPSARHQRRGRPGLEDDARPEILRGDAATEGALKEVRGPRILHLATHGFFLPDEPPPRPADDAAGAAMPGVVAAPPRRKIRCCARGWRWPVPTTCIRETRTASSRRSRPRASTCGEPSWSCCRPARPASAR